MDPDEAAYQALLQEPDPLQAIRRFMPPPRGQPGDSDDDLVGGSDDDGPGETGRGSGWQGAQGSMAGAEEGEAEEDDEEVLQAIVSPGGLHA